MADSRRGVPSAPLVRDLKAKGEIVKDDLRRAKLTPREEAIIAMSREEYIAALAEASKEERRFMRRVRKRALHRAWRERNVEAERERRRLWYREHEAKEGKG